MSSHIDMHELRRRWDESRQRGTALSAEALCEDCPELVEQVRSLLPQWAVEPASADPFTWSLSVESEPSKVPRMISLAAGLELVPGYRLTRPLGKGAFAEVWEATGPGGVRLALKVLSIHGAAPTTELRALELMKDVRHPHLLALSGYWQVNGLLVIAMELAEGTLWQRLQDCRKAKLPGIPAEELRGYLRDAADAIDFLNGARSLPGGKSRLGIQHRDIKPANLLLVGGRVKVGDFGLAKLLEHNVATHSGAMTVSYAAPECFNNQTTPFSDQYALAVTYCQLLGGRLPFEGPAASVMAGHLQGSPDLSMVPTGEQAVVARALAKKPDERWPSCRAFVKALEEASAKAAPAKPMPVSLFDQPTQLAAPLVVKTPPPASVPVPKKKVRPAVVAILSGLVGALFFVTSIVLGDRVGHRSGVTEFLIRPGILLGLCFSVLTLMGLIAAWRRTAYYYSGLLCSLVTFLWTPAAAITAMDAGNDGKAVLVFISLLTILSMAMLYHLSTRTLAEDGLPRRRVRWPLRALVLGVLLLPVIAAGLVEFARLVSDPYFVATLVPLLVVNGLYLLLPTARRYRTHWLPISFAVVPCLLGLTFLVGYAQGPRRQPMAPPMFDIAPPSKLIGSFRGRFVIAGQPSDVVYQFNADGRILQWTLNGAASSGGRWREALGEVAIDWDGGSFERASVRWSDDWTMVYHIVGHSDARQIGVTTTFHRQ